MRMNNNTVIQGDRVVLVPYRREHVEHYHKWMQDPWLQEATASDPLSIEEEYAMQRSWAEDEDKLTFIVLDRAAPDTPGTTGARGLGGMAGDVNLFFNDADGDRAAAEIEVMIAEPSGRRRGLAREALALLMAYASAPPLRVSRFVAKIGDANAPSLALFASLGFERVSHSDAFKESTLELRLVEVGEVGARLAAAAAALTFGAYDDGGGEGGSGAEAEVS